MEFRKNLNKCPIQGTHNPDNVYNLTHFRSFILRFLNETSSKIHLQILGVVHRGSPWTGYMQERMSSFSLGTWRGPGTRSTGVVHGPGAHVLYLSQIYIFSVCKSSFHAFLLFIGRFMMQTFNVTQQPAVIVFNSQGECEASAYF